MTQTFGTVQLPPANLLPGQIGDRLTALAEARQRLGDVQLALGNAKRIELAAARQRDIEAAADATERGERLPKGTAEAKVVAKIAGLEREASAARLVVQRCEVRLREAIEENREAIGRDAEGKLSDARKRYSDTIDKLDGIIADLAEALALATWSRDPAQSYRVRGLQTESPSTRTQVPLGELIAMLRSVGQPPRRAPLPSPFAVPAVEQPAPAPEVAPAESHAGHSYEAELRIGASVVNASND
jgi:hypothetical protein